MGRYRNNTNICIRREIIKCVGVALLITQITWLLLMQVQERRSSFGSEFTFIMGFGTRWDDYPIPIIKYLSLTLLPRHEYKFVHSLNILRYISLKWVAVCPLLENITT